MKKNLLILLSILVVSSLLVNTSCKTAEEIVYNLGGTWSFNLVFYVGSPDTVEITCTGGIAYDNTYGNTGTYTVTGNSFNITIPWMTISCGTGTDIYNGTFTTENSLSGSFTWAYTGCSDDPGTFTATR